MTQRTHYEFRTPAYPRISITIEAEGKHPLTAMVCEPHDLPGVIKAIVDDAEYLHRRGPIDVPENLSEEPVAKPLEEWNEDDGPAVWWKFPVNEPSWIGTPMDYDWPGYHTHWTRHPVIPLSPKELEREL